MFCIDASGANDCDNLFDYEDLLAKISKDFDSFVRDYFTCLVKTCSVDELAERVSNYASRLDIYGFDSDKEILLQNLSKEKFHQLEEKMLAKTQGMTKKDQEKHDIVYFLMNIAEEQEDKEKYLRLCERFRGVLSDEEYEYLKGEYEENRLLVQKIQEKTDELRNQERGAW